MISISSECLRAIEQDAANCYPYECCGLLLGFDRSGPNSELTNSIATATNHANSFDITDAKAGPTPEKLSVRTITLVIPAVNRREEAIRRRRFSIEPEDFLKAELAASEKNLSVVGIYHSHPDHQARPSANDLAQAWPFFSYLIVAVDNGQVGFPTSWRLNDDRKSYTQEQVLVTPEADQNLCPKDSD
ncbi:MAG: M67 family metallopeptidase [Deltaproteobacteria bacterium]|jgi:proteasome lid subunit RPN8/RPN11|nr:M67 family metallopeptidase [Deltaproteobacteria bacterium]